MIKGSFHTEESKKKIGIFFKGKKLPKRSDEHRRKLSESHKGKKLSDEHEKGMGNKKELWARKNEAKRTDTMSAEAKILLFGKRSNNQTTVVDSDNYEYLNMFRWYLTKDGYATIFSHKFRERGQY